MLFAAAFVPFDSFNLRLPSFNQEAGLATPSLGPASETTASKTTVRQACVISTGEGGGVGMQL